MGRLRVTALAVLWAWLCSCLGSARAEPLRVAFRVAEPADRALLTRVRGQTADLDVALEAVEGALRDTSSAQLEDARALDTRVVIWVTRAPDVLRLMIADFALDRVLVRSLPLRDGGALARSAQDEAAALIVRSALKASLAGGALGAPSEQVEQSEQVVQVATPRPPAAPHAAPPPARTAPVTPAPELELGLLSGLDGLRERGQHALTLRAQLTWRRLELALLGGVGLPGEIDAPHAELTLATHPVRAELGMQVLSRPYYTLSFLGGAGLSLLRLRARARDAELDASASRTPLLALQAYVRLVLRAPRWRAGISVRLGADVLPGRPALGYEQADTFTRVDRAWAVQPQLGLGVVAF